MANGVAAQNQGTQLRQSFFANNIATPMKNASVVYKQPQYHLITTLMQMIDGGEPEQAGDRKFEIFNKGRTDVVVDVSTRNPSGSTSGTLTLDLVDPDSTVVREKDAVLDPVTKTFGYVRKVSPGQIEIEPWGVDSFNSNDFDQGRQISVQFDISDDANSQGKATQYVGVEQEYNYAGVFQESVFISRNDVGQKTWVRAGGDEWFAMQAETDMMTRASKNLEKRILNSPREFKNGRHTPGGLDWYVTKYGLDYKVPSVPEQDDFLDIIRTQIRESGDSAGEITAIGGINAISRFQENVVGRYVQEYGKPMESIGNTNIGGINLDGYVYTFLGTRINLIRYHLLDDPLTFPHVSSITNEPIESDTIYFLNTTPVSGSLNDMAPFKRYYYGPKHMIYWYVGGSITPGDVNDAEALSSMGYSMGSTLADGMHAVFLVDEGYEFRYPERHAKMSLLK